MNVICGICPPGKHGDSCSNNCTYPHCFCSSERACEGCEIGYWDRRQNCSLTCIFPTCRCTNHTNCLSCKDGSYGLENKCNKTCPSGCDNNTCENNGMCFSCKPNYTGNKCDSCVDGLYGVNCSLQCSQGCEGNVCNSLDGSCNCSKMYSGEKCESCIDGLYGVSCSESCSTGCVQNNCSAINGNCDCKEYYKGDTCNVCVDGRDGDHCLNKAEIKNTQTEADKPNVGAAVGGAFSAVLVVVAGVLIVIILKRRNKLCWKKPRGDEQISEEIHTPQPIVYATVQKNRPKPVPAQERDTRHGYQTQQPHTSFTELHTEADNKLYEDISLGADNPNSIQENVNQETGRNFNVETQQVELFIVEETAEDAILEIDEDDQIARAIATKFEEKGGLYYNNADKINKQKVAIGNLTTYVVEKTDIDMEEEFEKFPYGLTKPYADSQTHENVQRNRYKGIYPYDDTRVKLSDCETDYINASFMDGYNKRHAYIAALGPMSKQLGDFSPFWQMIWQEKVEKIVMLTNLVEEGKDKCEQYWPNPGTDKHYGRVFISCQTEAEYAEFTRREFTISKDSETRQLHHLHFTCWPDKGVPEDVTGIVEFRQRVLNLPDQFDGPVLVHCSAGVGRTGTYIALDMLTKEGESEGAIHIPGCVINMRQDRAYMIQTLNQYQFLHRALVCSLSDISKQIRGKHFRQYMKQMEDEDFSRQFQEMQTVLEKSSDNEIQAIERNKSLKGKNRPFADVPGDRNRPSLSLDIQSGSSGYVNAVYIDSLKARNRFLVVQSPMKGTVIDFLTLLYQENCTCVISFEPPMAKQKRQTIGLYYPADNKILKQGVFQVCCTKTENHGYCIQRLLTIKHSGTTEINRLQKVQNQAARVVTNTPYGHPTTEVLKSLHWLPQPSERVVHHFEFNGWDYTREVPESTKDFLKFIEGIDVNLRETSNRGPLLVHCLDGAGKSALFCIVSILLEKMGLEQEVSVVNTIRKVKSRRRSAIPNKAQFEFCHGCVLSYVKSFDYSQYSNFTENVSNALNT
ncbi:receptor-type tyrosine-protein phosphatase F-like isoform X2 [Mya arenaria]|nr:receptor-type tyrosine-protein phosphatase F-like isoform X2 [Mya arenaria]XP_052762556.1 receptor-type tyrosine-protein phosphatase F-like isoform X2 [Mya arenaria]